MSETLLTIGDCPQGHLSHPPIYRIVTIVNSAKLRYSTRGGVPCVSPLFSIRLRSPSRPPDALQPCLGAPTRSTRTDRLSTRHLTPTVASSAISQQPSNRPPAATVT